MRFADKLKALFKKGAVDSELFDELADILIEGDLGAAFAFSAAEELRSSCASKKISDPMAVRRELKRILAAQGRQIALEPREGRLCVILMLGVNGVGKTTSAAKLARYYGSRHAGRGIILAAADTFRAAAVEQLKIHGQRLGLRVVAQGQGADPGAVIWDALDAAKAEGAGILIADTAGRMHTRGDLVRELAKIDKVVAARAADADYRRLLVLDATTGQNAMRQAEIFSSAIPIDGIVLSKMDSSAKGGMALSLAKELSLPTAFIGTGEGYDDFKPFSLEAFLDDFLGLDA